MKVVSFVDRKLTVWMTSNNIDQLHDFVQYVLDSCNDPTVFYMVDHRDCVGRLMDIAKAADMRKRTFEERMGNVKVGDLHRILKNNPKTA